MDKNIKKINRKNYRFLGKHSDLLKNPRLTDLTTDKELIDYMQKIDSELLKKSN